MAITPQEFPRPHLLARSRRRMIWIVAGVIAALALGGAWWFRDALGPILAPPAETRLPDGPGRAGASSPLPDFSILDDPVLRTLRRFDTLPSAATTSARRSNPFAPF